MKKYENFVKALNNLKEVEKIDEPYSVIGLAAGTSLFQICFEQSWKAIKEIMNENGFSEGKTGSPKQIIKSAYAAGIIDDEQKWLDMLDSRNEVSHSYNEEVAADIVNAVKSDYIGLFEELKEKLERDWLTQ